MCVGSTLLESQSTSNSFRHAGCSVTPGGRLYLRTAKFTTAECSGFWKCEGKTSGLVSNGVTFVSGHSPVPKAQSQPEAEHSEIQIAFQLSQHIA